MRFVSKARRKGTAGMDLNQVLVQTRWIFVLLVNMAGNGKLSLMDIRK
jgi:hypothetical protein